MQLSPKEFEYQFRCLYRPLNMYALRYTENLDDAEDIVQQAFSDVWEKLVGGTSIQNLKAYMYQTARRIYTIRQIHHWVMSSFVSSVWFMISIMSSIGVLSKVVVR